MVKLPEPLKRPLRPPRRRKKDIGVEEKPVHSSNPAGPKVRDCLRVEAHGPNRGDGAGVVGSINSVGQKELGLPLRCVDLDR